MKNVRLVREDEVGVISFDPDTGSVIADQGAIIYINFAELEKDEYINRTLPLSLKLFFRSVIGYFDGKPKIISFEFPTEKPVMVSTPVKHVQVSRKEIEKYLKDNPKADTIMLTKTNKSTDGFRRYGVELDREILLDHQSGDNESGNLDSFNPKSHFYSKRTDKKI